MIGRAVRPGRRVVAALAVATVAAQIAYPLLDGAALRALTLAVVVLFCLTSLTDAALRWGPRTAAALLAVAAALGLAAETLGVHTGVPFGTYAYSDALQPQVLGVPVIVPLAWTMMAYPSLILGRTLAGRAPGGAALVPGAARGLVVALTGGWTLAAWDVFLDPQMVSVGNWIFASGSPGLPGLAPLPSAALADGVAPGTGIPWTNHVGWLLVGTLLVAVLDRVAPGEPGAGTTRGRGHRTDLLVPAAILVWTWLGSALALAVFLDMPAAAGWGLIAMGLTVAPFVQRLRPGRVALVQGAQPRASVAGTEGRR